MVDALAGLAADASLHPDAAAQLLEQLLRWAPEIGRTTGLAVVDELLANWERARRFEPLVPIPPLP
jgi:hypothetical protein